MDNLAKLDKWNAVKKSVDKLGECRAKCRQ